jgi:peptidoglycan hydrolase CwlO-like protein
MCGGSKAPKVVYQGPSAEDLAASQASLDMYQRQMTDQQSAFKAQLQAQIDKANQETTELQSKYASDSAAAAAAAAAQQTGAYAATAMQTDAPVNAATTTASTKKEKPKNNLKIAPAATPAAAGTGLNIGI